MTVDGKPAYPAAVTVEEILTAAVEAVMHHEWMPGHNFSPTTAHIAHKYDASCAVCRGDVRRILEVVLPVWRKAEAESERREAAYFTRTHP